MEFHYRRTKGSDKRPISIGDLVLLRNDFTNRSFLKIASVEELNHSADGKVRAAVVKVSNKANQPVYLWRVIQLLTPTEVKSCPQHNHELFPSGTRVNDNQRCQHNAVVLGVINQRENFNWFLVVRFVFFGKVSHGVKKLWVVSNSLHMNSNIFLHFMLCNVLFVQWWHLI